MSDQITPEMYHHWKQHPVTRRFMEDLEGYRLHEVRRITDYDLPCDVETTAKAKGTVNGLDLALGWEVE